MEIVSYMQKDYSWNPSTCTCGYSKDKDDDDDDDELLLWYG